MLELVCQVSGYPEPRLEFYHNGNRVTDNESQRVEYREHGEWSLTVRRLGQHHSGEWSVTAENSLGSSTRDWTLAVNEQAPATPEVISAPPRFRDEVKIVKEGKQHVREERHKPQVQHNQNEKTGVYSKMSVNDSAPMAGSLADKEHRKWTENAVTMINNPYTRDNIERRQRTGGLSSRIMSSQTTDGDHGIVDTSDTGQKIYCGLRTVPSSRYNRDYFVNPDDKDRSSFRDISFSPELKVPFIDNIDFSFRVSSSSLYFRDQTQMTKMMTATENQRIGTVELDHPVSEPRPYLCLRVSRGLVTCTGPEVWTVSFMIPRHFLSRPRLAPSITVLPHHPPQDQS